MASVCSSSRLPPARSAAAMRESIYSTPTVSLPVDSTLVASPCPGADAHQRDADHAAQFQVGDAVLRTRFVAAERVEIHGEQFPPMLQRAVEHFARHAQVAVAQVCARCLWRATRVSRPSPRRSSRKPRSAPVMASAVSTTEASTSSTEKELCTVRARSRMARSLARLPPSAGGWRGLLGGAHLFQQALQLRAVQREDQLIGILRAEFDLSEFSSLCRVIALAVDEGAVRAAAILHHAGGRPR